mmetsp:Transcript_28588/g.78579  ORF Transcript_28588/g.78579 Transcript_28588/m.78579 type:complete len:477 (-) Transcript_28588:86-1516(-)
MAKSRAAGPRPRLAVKKPAAKARVVPRRRMVAGFPAASPTAVGMSPAVLAKISAGTRLEVHKLGSIAGVAHIVLRRGLCVFALADGWADRERGVRFRLDTLCRLHGSTKSVIAAAFLALLEERRVALDDHVTKYIRFSERVAIGGQGRSRPARVRPTLRHLLTMTAGVLYTDCPAYAEVIGAVRRGELTDLASFCDALAEVPLQFEPGSRHEYSFCTDFVGRVCEVVSGEDLDTFVRRRLLRPLGMLDTHFVVPPQKRSRCATLYECKPVKSSGKQLHYKARRYSHRDIVPGIMSAGGGILTYFEAGMWGTAKDYARFCHMLLNDGRAANGAQVLLPATVRAIWRDGLAPFARADGRLAGWNVDATEGPPWEGGSWDECGFSPLNSLLQRLQGSPRPRYLQPPRGSGPPRLGRAMGLGGGGGTYWYVDRERELVALTFSQSFSGGRPEDDGLGPPGNDCVDIAVEAVNAGTGARKE